MKDLRDLKDFDEQAKQSLASTSGDLEAAVEKLLSGS